MDVDDIPSLLVCNKRQLQSCCDSNSTEFFLVDSTRRALSADCKQELANLRYTMQIYDADVP